MEDAEVGKVSGANEAVDAAAIPGDSSETGSWSPGSETSTEASEEPLFQFMTGIKEDLKARVPLYLDDWSRPKSICTD
jgi:hypothetical protein